MRLVLCDDHRLFVESMALALESRGHQVVVTTAPAEALRAVGEHDADLCLLDLRFPDGDGLDAVARMHARYPWCVVVVLSASPDPADVAAALAAGATAFLRKDQPVRAVFEALERIADGRGVPLPPAPRTEPAGADDDPVRRLVAGLTRREREVLRLLLEAGDTAVIARSLGVAPSTARSHLQNVFMKLGVHSRLQAVALVGDLPAEVLTGTSALETT